MAFIEPVGIVEAANDTAAPAMGADAYRSYTDAGGWTGTAGQGVAVGVMDSGLNINHVDIESGRLSVCGANFVSSLEEEQDLWVDAGLHGTHVTATVAGNGAAERRYAGMAPLAPHIRFAKVLSWAWFRFRCLHLRRHGLPGAALVVRSGRLDGRRRRAADREHEPVGD